jgi:hypothetical protein
MITGFYERQLVILSSICVLSLILERYFSKPRQLPKQSPEERLENGSSPRGSTNSLAILTRQYLVVYALVMGELFVPSVCCNIRTQSVLHRRRLATRALRLFPIQRTVWIYRTLRSCPFCHWLSLCCCFWSFNRCLG